MKRLLFALLAVLAASSCAEKPYVIVQVADAQLGFTAADFSQKTREEYVNDLTYESECLTRAVEYINSMKPDAVVFTGDQVNRADDQEQWDAFAGIISGIDSDIRVFHLPGNHDVRIENDSVDSTPFTSRYGADRFAFSEKGVNMAGINTNLIKAGDSKEAAQVDWLYESLSSLPDENVTIVFGHHSFFMTDIEEEEGYFTATKDERYFYFDVFESLGVDAFYAGHRHASYEGEYHGIKMITTTSVAFQIGDGVPSVRVITIKYCSVSDELVAI